VSAFQEQWQLTGLTEFVFGPRASATIDGAQRTFTQALKSLGLPGMNWHSLRITSAARMASNGAPIAVICQSMGWSMRNCKVRWTQGAK